MQHEDLGGKAHYQCANCGRKYTVKWVLAREWRARPYTITHALVAKHVGTHVNKGVEDSRLVMAKLTDCSNNVNQGGIDDVGVSAIICISSLFTYPQ